MAWITGGFVGGKIVARPCERYKEAFRAGAKNFYALTDLDNDGQVDQHLVGRLRNCVFTVTNGSRTPSFFDLTFNRTPTDGGVGGGGGGGGSGEGGTVITAIGERPQSEEPESTWDKLKACTAAQYGFGDGETPTGLDFGRMVSEVGALPIPKRLVGVPVIGNSSTVTNAVSLIPHKLGIRLNTGTQILGSGRVFGVLGRANAVVGGVMLAWDAASIAICTGRD